MLVRLIITVNSTTCQRQRNWNFLSFRDSILTFAISSGTSSGQLVFIYHWRVVCRREAELANSEERYILDILRRLSRNFYGRLIFAGIIDDKAKLIHFQKGEVAFRLPIERQNALDVQVSLMLTLGRQFEDFARPLTHMVLTYHGCEIIMMDVLPQLHMYVICTKGSAAGMTDMLTKLVEEAPGRVARGPDFVEDEWS